MTADVPVRPTADSASQTSLRSRLYGYGSIFGKAIRDSRRAFLIEVVFLAAFLFLMLAAFGSVYSTAAARDEIARVASEIGAAGGLVGPIVKVGTMPKMTPYR